MVVVEKVFGAIAGDGKLFYASKQARHTLPYRGGPEC